MFRSQGVSKFLVHVQTNLFYVDGSTEIILGKFWENIRKIGGEISL